MANKDIKITENKDQFKDNPDWLLKNRSNAVEAYNSSDLPPRGLHLWRYTDPERFVYNKENEKTKTYGESLDKVKALELESLKDNQISSLVIDKGGEEIEIIKSDDFDNDVVISSLTEALANHGDLVSNNLYQNVHSSLGKFESMNGALWNDGVLIYVPKNKQVKAPIHLIREAALAGSVQFPRLLVVVDEGAEITIVDEYSGGPNDLKEGYSYSNSAVEIIGKANSHTRYVVLQRQNMGAVNYLCHRATIDDSASMLTIPLSFGSAISKQNFGVSLNGRGADSNMYGLLFGTERQHFDNHTLHHHTIGNTTSNIDFKVVLKDRANSAYTGLIKIDKNAKTCEAYQENRNLLLNKGCQAETIPELEILNEDVMCSHGATLGPIDPEMVFYLMGRGIEKDEAVKMIVSGYISSTLKQVPEDIKERLEESIARRLEDI